MQSDVVSVSPQNIAPALELVERTVTYIGYPREFGERMRLLAEELIGAIRFVLEETSATLWVNTDQTNMEIHLRLEGLLSDAARRKLVDISKCRCNEPPKGLFSRIGAFFSDAFMTDAAEYVPLFIDGGEGMGSYAMPLSLLTEEWEPQKSAEPAELRDVEANLLRGLADDVTVCARPSQAELTVIKKLPEKH